MKRNKITMDTQTLETMVCESFKSTGYLIVNKTLLKNLGLINAVLMSLLIDKHQYWKEKDDFDGSFFVTHERITEETGISDHQIRKSKEELKKLHFIKTHRKGTPSKEYYKINFENLYEGLVLEKFKGLSSKNSSTSPRKIQGLYKENRIKENKSKDISLSENFLNEKNGKEWGIPNIENNDNGLTPNIKKNDKGGTPNIKKNNKPTVQERNEICFPLAEKLSEIIRSTKNIKHNKTLLKSWTNEIRKLNEVDGVPIERIKQALDWYENNIGGQYIPVIESGYTFRQKFIKLENAIEREKTSYDNSGPRNGSKYKGFKDTYKLKKADKII